MVRNMSDSHIFLKKGVPVVRVVSASPVPPMELLPEMQATLGMEDRPEPMSVVARQEKLLEKLNLDGLAHWSPRNAAAVRELVLAYHDVFVLRAMSWVAPVPSSMRYTMRTVSALRSSLGAYLHPYWRKCMHHSGTC